MNKSLKETQETKKKNNQTGETNNLSLKNWNKRHWKKQTKKQTKYISMPLI